MSYEKTEMIFIILSCIVIVLGLIGVISTKRRNAQMKKKDASREQPEKPEETK